MFRIDRSQVQVTSSEDLHANTTPEEEANPILDVVKQSEAQLQYLSGVAEDMIKNAAKEAADRIAQAEMEAIEIKARAYKKAVAKAKEEAQAYLEAKRKEDAASVRRLLAEIRRAREEMFDEIEEDVLDLTFAIVKKIINVALEKDDKVFESMLKKALTQMKWEGKIAIRVSSGEYERYFSSGSATFVLGDESITATMVDDPTLPPGGCIIESEGETINAGLDSQLKFISLAFRNPEGQQP